MTTTPCTHLDEFLEQQPDGPLPNTALAHMDACPDCRSLWRDLSGIREAGRELGAQEPAPPEKLWVNLRAQMVSEGLIAETPVPQTRVRETHSGSQIGWLAAWLGSVARPALAGAYFSLMLVAAALATYVNYQPSARSVASAAPGRFTPVAAVSVGLGKTLEGDMERVMASLPQRDPALATSVRQNLGIVDNLIAVCEKSVREQPDNPLARQYLYDAYQQKAVLLATAMDSTLEDK